LDAGQAVSSAPRWWGLLLCFYGLIFVVVAIPLVTAFRRIRSRRSLVGCVANLFVSCLFFALAAITDDRLVLPALSSVGLGTLSPWLFGIAWLWSFLALYFLFDDEDTTVRLPQ
jgi:predicted MFS family arabinose efflux permease